MRLLVVDWVHGRQTVTQRDSQVSNKTITKANKQNVPEM